MMFMRWFWVGRKLVYRHFSSAVSDTVIYFAYGSNLLFARLHARTPSIRNLGVGKLHHHKLSFTKPGGDGSGKCGIEKVQGEEYVLGVLYEMSVSEKPILDEIEGAGHGYIDQPVEVDSESGSISAFTYYPTHLDCEFLPYDWYKRLVLNGAIENNFPKGYRSMIEAVETVDDPDVERRKANLMIGV